MNFDTIKRILHLENHMHILEKSWNFVVKKKKCGNPVSIGLEKFTGAFFCLNWTISSNAVKF